jgi:uncharacterized FAD-dependent dehydrogenase
MSREVDIKLPPEKLDNNYYIRQFLETNFLLNGETLFDFHLIKRSVDARGRDPLFQLRYELFVDEPPIERSFPKGNYLSNLDKGSVAIIGAGPAGYFAALECLTYGLKPLVFDRGKDVRARRKDLRAIQQFGWVHPNSNYCFGEGGAGTYSDGKLYTRSKKRGDIEKIASILVEHGAKEDILIDAHPHIGSNKLPGILANIRQTITDCGGEIHFEHKLIDIEISGGKVKGLVFDNGQAISAENVILATGHSARDIYYLLHEKGISIEAKPFALGVRVEHRQELIDEIQYNRNPRGENLPAAAYALSCQVEGQGVFSFCMCPGGLIVPAATAHGEIVVNGMSLSRRDSPFSNSGVVVSVDPSKMKHFERFGVFAGIEYQKSIEQYLFQQGPGDQKAPAQRVTDFVKGKLSSSLNDTSYIPGLFSAPLQELLPSYISTRLREGFKVFGKKMKGYLTENANIVGTESRTSAPIKIPRDPITLMHPQVKGLYPCGEGAGYAGGIMSAAMDGQKVVQTIAKAKVLI